MCAGGPGGQAGQPAGPTGQPGGEATPADDKNCKEVQPEQVTILPDPEPKVVIEGLPADEPATVVLEPKDPAKFPDVKVTGKSNPDEKPADEPVTPVRTPAARCIHWHLGANPACFPGSSDASLLYLSLVVFVLCPAVRGSLWSGRQAGVLRA